MKMDTSKVNIGDFILVQNEESDSPYGEEFEFIEVIRKERGQILCQFSKYSNKYRISDGDWSFIVRDDCEQQYGFVRIINPNELDDFRIKVEHLLEMKYHCDRFQTKAIIDNKFKYNELYTDFGSIINSLKKI